AACGGGGGGSTPPAPKPPVTNPSPPPGGGTQSSAACPTSGSATASVGASTQSVAMRAPAVGTFAPQYVPGMIVYTDTAGSMHVRAVDPQRVDRELSRLQTSPGVRSVQRAQYRRILSFTPNDPYYHGFGPGSPYFESSTEPGQWDMHVIGLSSAWSSSAR